MIVKSLPLEQLKLFCIYFVFTLIIMEVYHKLVDTKCAVVEWLEHSAVVLKVAGSSFTHVNDWKTLAVHPAVNRYLMTGMILSFRTDRSWQTV